MRNDVAQGALLLREEHEDVLAARHGPDLRDLAGQEEQDAGHHVEDARGPAPVEELVEARNRHGDACQHGEGRQAAVRRQVQGGALHAVTGCGSSSG